MHSRASAGYVRTCFSPAWHPLRLVLESSSRFVASSLPARRQLLLTTPSLPFISAGIQDCWWFRKSIRRSPIATWRRHSPATSRGCRLSRLGSSHVRSTSAPDTSSRLAPSPARFGLRGSRLKDVAGSNSVTVGRSGPCQQPSCLPISAQLSAWHPMRLYPAHVPERHLVLFAIPNQPCRAPDGPLFAGEARAHRDELPPVGTPDRIESPERLMPANDAA